MTREVSDPHPNLTAQAIEMAIGVLEAIALDRSPLAHVGAEARERLQRAAGAIARPDLKARKALQKALQKKEHDDKKAHDNDIRDATGIRALRREAVFVTPSPALVGIARQALPPPGVDAEGWQPAPPTPRPTDADNDADNDADDGPRLLQPRKCYVCKTAFTRLHHFYDQMCKACGDFNFGKRTSHVDLRGRTALITGARVKIGYQAAILMLRAGCSVVACTRFPVDAAQRYAREPDFSVWKDRLQIFGLDLRHTPSVESLAQHLSSTLPRLDFQIHNACQTVRRPPGFYAHLLDAESQTDAATIKPVLAQYRALQQHEADKHIGLFAPALLTQARSQADAIGTTPLLGDGHSAGAALFPTGVLDQDLQQRDLRTHNSWRLTLAEVPTLELLEVMLVNATAPFVMASKLKPLMQNSATAPTDTATSHDNARHIVMVSAMEGQFYREHKTDKHPHTNMAKAALNMLVRTSAQDYARAGIYLNAVDTGWVTDEDPAHLADKKSAEHAFSPPLDIVDGAARIVDPIIAGFQTGQHRAGLFLKDYVAVPW